MLARFAVSSRYAMLAPSCRAIAIYVHYRQVLHFIKYSLISSSCVYSFDGFFCLRNISFTDAPIKLRKRICVLVLRCARSSINNLRGKISPMYIRCTMYVHNVRTYCSHPKLNNKNMQIRVTQTNKNKISFRNLNFFFSMLRSFHFGKSGVYVCVCSVCTFVSILCRVNNLPKRMRESYFSMQQANDGLYLRRTFLYDSNESFGEHRARHTGCRTE